MVATQDTPFTTEPNPFLIHLIGVREWLEEKLDGPAHDLWFTPRGMDGKTAVKLELLAIDTMLEYIYAQMDAGRTVEEIRGLSKEFALQECKKASLKAKDEDTSPIGQYTVLSNIYRRMCLTTTIL
ncbi:MAG: hypothetical protein H9W81_13530 [Enterococcus sp.]|nr:hypothetical protein [Enterococcus sp.]